MRFEIGSLRPSKPLLAAIGLAAASALAMAALQAFPHDDTQVAAVFAPWTSGGEAIERVVQTDGSVVRHGRFRLDRCGAER